MQRAQSRSRMQRSASSFCKQTAPSLTKSQAVLTPDILAPLPGIQMIPQLRVGCAGTAPMSQICWVRALDLLCSWGSTITTPCSTILCPKTWTELKKTPLNWPGVRAIFSPLPQRLCCIRKPPSCQVTVMGSDNSSED